MIHNKLKKLIDSPSKFTEDFFKTRPKLKLKIEALSKKIPFASWHYILYKGYLDRGYFGKAEKSMKQVINLKKKPIYFYELGITLKKRKIWWQAAEAFANAINLSSTPKSTWYKEYAQCLTQMNQHLDAANSWEKALSLGSKNSHDWFLYGYALELSGENQKSHEAYVKAIEYDKHNNANLLGIGIFHQKHGYWKEASIAYKKTILIHPLNAILHYNLALSLDRCYAWEAAEEAYLAAIALQPKNIDWYYRLGFVRERAKKYTEAAQAYKYAAENRKIHTPYWYYRLGYVLNKIENYQESCEAFLKMKNLTSSEKKEVIDYFSEDLKTYSQKYIQQMKKLLKENTANTENWHKLANAYNNIGEYASAIVSYKKLIERKETFDENLYFSLGHMLALQKEYTEASKVFIQQKIIQYAHGMIETSYNKNIALKKVVNYTEYYEGCILEEKTILYESYHGSSISCNPYAIFKSLLKDKRFEDFKHIWILNDKNKIPIELKNNENIIFIQRNCDLYMRYLAKAKYLINNVTFPEYFIRKEGQIYLNTWHGTPLKNLGKDVKDNFMAHKNITRNFLQASHLIQPNPYTTEIILDRYDIRDVFSGIVAETGYPRQDLMLNITQDEKVLLQNTLNVPKDKTVILYAPTWRGAHGKAVFDTSRLENDLKAMSSIQNVHLLFRGHHMIEKLLNHIDIQATTVPSDIDTNTLLSIVDILITDYSSIAFDYMALKRPIIYYAYDRKEYAEERGFYFPLEDLGGDLCSNQKDLLTAIKKCIKHPEINTLQKAAQNKFCIYDTGTVTKNVIELVFFNSKNIKIIENSKKKTIILYGGQFMANGITTSFINLLNHIDYTIYNIIIFLEPNVIKKDPIQLEQLYKVHSNISIIPRVGSVLMTLEEKWIREKFESQNTLASTNMWNFYEKSFKREYLRIIGTKKIDALIHFEGYNRFWVSIFAYAPNNLIKTKAIYQHSDMLSEKRTKYPKLEINFKLYKYFNHIVSVSKETKIHNRENLSNLFDLNPKNFIYCDNIQNPEDLLEKAKEPLENKKDEIIFQDTKVFINIARLSPEKDQEKLIYAFKQVSKIYPNARLVNLGSGPLEHHLSHLIKKLKLEKKVFFLGQRSNPYPYLKKADCFILSSNHEGQPMTLFEALILEKPIIATDIIGNRSVLEGRSGQLVENSEDGLTQGMLDFLKGKSHNDKIFDYAAYNQNALNMFYEKVIN